MGLPTSAYAPLALLAGYLLGSIPFGLLLTRAAGLGDVRKIGSGNIGATNVLRTGAKGLAAATLLFDMLKGTAAVACIGWLLPLAGDPLAYVAGLGALLGHVFPGWLYFLVGQGVSTYIGALIGLHWPAAGLFCLVWISVAALTRYSSLAALVATGLVLLYYALLGEAGLLFIMIMTLLIFAKHHANLRRLIAGKESKI